MAAVLVCGAPLVFHHSPFPLLAPRVVFRADSHYVCYHFESSPAQRFFAQQLSPRSQPFSTLSLLQAVQWSVCLHCARFHPIARERKRPPHPSPGLGEAGGAAWPQQWLWRVGAARRRSVRVHTRRAPAHHTRACTGALVSSSHTARPAAARLPSARCHSRRHPAQGLVGPFGLQSGVVDASRETAWRVGRWLAVSSPPLLREHLLHVHSE